MGINKDQLVYDPTDSESDSVGAYLRASDGTHIDATSNALHVHIASGADFDIRDLSHTQDSIKIGDGTDFLAIAADGSIAITDNGGSLTVDSTDLATLAGTVSGTELQVDVLTMPTVTVTATDLDIRNLLSSQDNVEIKTAAGVALAIDASGFLTSKISDGTDSLVIETDGSINTNSTFAGFATFQNPTVVTIGVAAVQLNAAILANRKSVLYQNTGNTTLYLGNSGVNTTNGIIVPKGASVELAYGPTIDMYAVSSGAGGKMRAIEAA